MIQGSLLFKGVSLGVVRTKGLVRIDFGLAYPFTRVIQGNAM